MNFKNNKFNIKKNYFYSYQKKKILFFIFIKFIIKI